MSLRYSCVRGIPMKKVFISLLPLIPGLMFSWWSWAGNLERSLVSQKEPKQVESKPSFVQDEKTVAWFDARALGLEGRGWLDEPHDGAYGRLPSRAKGVVRAQQTSRMNTGTHRMETPRTQRSPRGTKAERTWLSDFIRSFFSWRAWRS
jgi:hypothetical protein